MPKAETAKTKASRAERKQKIDTRLYAPYVGEKEDFFFQFVVPLCKAKDDETRLLLFSIFRQAWQKRWPLYRSDSAHKDTYAKALLRRDETLHRQLVLRCDLYRLGAYEHVPEPKPVKMTGVAISVPPSTYTTLMITPFARMPPFNPQHPPAFNYPAPIFGTPVFQVPLLAQPNFNQGAPIPSSSQGSGASAGASAQVPMNAGVQPLPSSHRDHDDLHDDLDATDGDEDLDDKSGAGSPPTSPTTVGAEIDLPEGASAPGSIDGNLRSDPRPRQDSTTGFNNGQDGGASLLHDILPSYNPHTSFGAHTRVHTFPPSLLTQTSTVSSIPSGPYINANPSPSSSYCPPAPPFFGFHYATPMRFVAGPFQPPSYFPQPNILPGHGYFHSGPGLRPETSEAAGTHPQIPTRSPLHQLADVALAAEGDASAGVQGAAARANSTSDLNAATTSNPSSANIQARNTANCQFVTAPPRYRLYQPRGRYPFATFTPHFLRSSSNNPPSDK